MSDIIKDTENEENQPYVDPDEIKRPTSFKAWLENYWYHYKWHTVIAAFFLALAVMLVTQMATKDKYDVTVIYSGPVQLNGGELEQISKAFAELMPKDYNGDGEKNAMTYSEYLLSPEQQRALEEEAKRLSIEENVEYVFFYTADMRNDALNSVNALVSTGEAVICLMDKYNYDILCANSAFLPLSDALGEKPDYAIDDYGVYLKNTDFAKYFEKTFEKLPDDTILCIRKKAVVGVSKGFDKVYEANLDLFTRIFEFKITSDN